MPINADIFSAVAAFLIVALIAMVAWVIKVGHMYRPITPERLQEVVEDLNVPTLYHYMRNPGFDDRVDLQTGNFTCTRRRWPYFEPNIVGRRAIFFYAGHYGTGARSNHNRQTRRDAAVVRLDLNALLAATDSAPLYFRRWDRAIAVLADYSGPITAHRRDVNIVTSKNDPRPPC